MNPKKSQQPAVCHGHSRPIVEVNYSQVTPDGYFLVSASKDGHPMLRDGPTGDWIGTFEGHKGCVWSCVLDPTATVAATGSADFSAKLWDALTGLERATLPHNHIVRTCNFSPDSHKLVTGGMEKALRIFDVEQPAAAPQMLPKADAGIRSACFLGPTTILSCYTDGKGIGVWDVRAGSLVKTLPTDNPVTSFDLTFDGSVLTTTDGHTIRFWETASLDAPFKQHTVAYPVEAASYCPSRKRFAAGGADMWVRLHDMEDARELECNKGHHGPVHTIRFGPEGKEYATGSEDGTIRIWQTDWLEQQAAGAAGGQAVSNGKHA